MSRQKRTGYFHSQSVQFTVKTYPVMEFGKLHDLSRVDWTLPQEDLKNAIRLAKTKNPIQSKLVVGASTWGSKHWLGKIYPEKTPAKNFLHHYSRNFDSIELNASHYRIPSPGTCKEWLAQVPVSFQFCPKLNKEISHTQSGLLDPEKLQDWIYFLENIQSHLGPCFIQFHELFSYHEKALLFRFLERWPRDYEIALELRHPSWFQNGIILPALSDYLHKKGIGLVITDVAGRRDVLHSSLSAPFTFIRLIGNSLHSSDELRLKDWATRIKSWQKMGLEKTYLFLHEPDDLTTIEFTEVGERVFKEAGFEHFPKMNRVESEADLFFTQ